MHAVDGSWRSITAPAATPIAACSRSWGRIQALTVSHSGDCAWGLLRFLDTLESEGSLPKTILFSLNPNDNRSAGLCNRVFPGHGGSRVSCSWRSLVVQRFQNRNDRAADQSGESFPSRQFCGDADRFPQFPFLYEA